MARSVGNLTYRPGRTALRLRAMSHSPAITLLADVKTRLAERLRQVNAEIRAYPQPIARCDAQLGGLLAERERIRVEIEKLDRIQGKLSRE